MRKWVLRPYNVLEVDFVAKTMIVEHLDKSEKIVPEVMAPPGASPKVATHFSDTEVVVESEVNGAPFVTFTLVRSSQILLVKTYGSASVITTECKPYRKQPWQ